MFAQDIPPELRQLLLEQQRAKERLVQERTRLTNELNELLAAHAAARVAGADTRLPRKDIKIQRGRLAATNDKLAAALADLRKTLRQCHQYEPKLSPRSNVADHATHLRMPATRSSCYSHAVRFPTRDDS